jgi:6-phosphogluconolactonase/glucosamine-6-phosphate isomerase/deaminase
MTEPTVVVLPDPDACALAAAERIVEILDVAIDNRGEAHWVTTGGSSPAAIYQHLADDPLRAEIDWRKVHLWFTDERFVPPDHPLSNAKIANSILLSTAMRSTESGTGGSGLDVFTGRLNGVAIPGDQVHPFPTSAAIGEGHDEAWCAARYVELIRADGPEVNADGWPVFDLMLLGIGPDGHLLSVFPGSAAFDRSEWAVGIPAPTHVEPHVSRVTLNPAIVPATRELLAVSTGAAKAEVLRDILRGERDERRLPGQLGRRPGATWILDEAAARLL